MARIDIENAKQIRQPMDVVITVTPESGDPIIINNENLISCVVSLRSDTSPFDQTLPESELNVEAYYDDDISDAVATIPDDTPIYYQAGYSGDMSPVRKFYLAEQITWADNVLSIHAVDAVHFLDNVEITAPITSKDAWVAVETAGYLLGLAGIDYEDSVSRRWGASTQRLIIRNGTSARDYIAFVNQCFNVSDINGELPDSSYTLKSPLMYAYVDAGIPTAATSIFLRDFRRSRLIYKEDCADVKRHVERLPGAISADVQTITNQNAVAGDATAQKVGSATMNKNIGTSITFDKMSFEWLIGLYLGENVDNDIAEKMGNKYGVIWGLYKVFPVVPARNNGVYTGYADDTTISFLSAKKLAFDQIPQSEYRSDPFDPSTDKTSFSSFVPWNQSYSGWRYDDNSSHLITTASQMWNVLTNANVIDAGAETIDLDIYGAAYNLDIATYNYARNAQNGVYKYGDLPLIGYAQAKTTASNGATVRLFPNYALRAGLYRSNITGSFVWKGDPRMQPRDIVSLIGDQYELATEDGDQITDEDGNILGGLEVTTITIESITLTHEGGGTTAEITYREGIF